MNELIQNYSKYSQSKIIENIKPIGIKGIESKITFNDYSKEECLKEELAIKLELDFNAKYISETNFIEQLKQIFEATYYSTRVNIEYDSCKEPELCKPAVFLQASTGIGKTTAMCELLRYYKKLNPNKKPLYLVNRTALKMQIKKELLKFDKELLSICKRDGKLDFDVLEFHDEVAEIEVITYHKFFSKKNIKYDDYSIIVADEAHFFCADSLFLS